jgi:hypothetical protein
MACAPMNILAADMLTQHNDNARIGVNSAETVLTTHVQGGVAHGSEFCPVPTP